MSFPRHEIDQTPDATRSRDVHHRLQPYLKAWLDGELTMPVVWYVRAHLCVCAACREEVKWLKRLGEDMRDLERAVPSPRLRARILAALPDTPPGRPDLSYARKVRWTQFAAVGAAACLGIAVFAAAIIKVAPLLRPEPLSPAVVTLPDGSPLNRRAAAPDGPPPLVIAPEAGSDPYTERANKMYAQWDQRATQQLHNNIVGWSKLTASVHALHGARRVDEPLRLSLAVPDPSDAEDRLAAWTKSVGGTFSSRTHPQASSTSVAPLVSGIEPVYHPAAAAPVGLEPVINLRVPLARIASLEPVLRQMGAWDSIPAAQTSSIERARTPERRAQPGKTRSQPGSPVVAVADARVRPTNIEAARPGSLDPVAAGRDGDIAWVSLQIRLSGLETLP